MTNVKIVTDSSCTMEKSICEDLNIHVMPLSIMIDGVMYRDDETLGGEKFMDMMEKATALPKTSQPPIGEFVELYDELGKDGSKVISIHMTKGLSGTVEAARQASNMSQTDVTVIDSDFTDQGLSFQVIRAAELAKNGASVPEILAEIQYVHDHTKLFIGISTLNNLVKGGRISRATGLLSNIFNMRVVMDFENSELIPVAKGRGSKTFTKWFNELKNELIKLGNVRQIGISHADGLEIVNEFKKGLQELFPDMTIHVLHTNPVIATHTGKGAFAIMYYTD
ncbi:DegV family EDD domain-containing protein [Enterococcus phoeniculicola]|jgi:DegV family protein with EDD domain|uniref:DegV family EDD domain-containing protein n=1 Tax=Enterococcus phoeniculicola ATCC BAA-412 TaxID=1158610 RepID=R3W5X0_9ENTE|nr:DegV family protein [Enterococcus phoeniculicola]EOL43056.1 DegV family EDD domain-containing protein [Enterococcus phoeniculicola ATCC BAA-412]EOT76586.1 DegV family protein [Enterococcus phoeniculicola ATCC BAA-412]OJG72157.1 DegV family EDD domain-containing protein [Enterococcus phoeniculicola]